MNKFSIALGGRRAATEEEIVDALARLAHPLTSPKDFDPLLERIGEAHHVLLGEASHGTSEFYVSRARLSQRLIAEKGFNFIAVEGDWPDCYRVNRYVKGYPDAGASAAEVLGAFARWPTWMWANWEIVALAEWMRAFNERLPEEQKVGFYGLDVYSLWESLAAIIDYLERTDPDAAIVAREAYRCFEPYGENVQTYARATIFLRESCEPEVVSLLTELRRNAPAYEEDGREAYFNAEQNALVLRGAERYYRAMVRADNDSWNIRDRHMALTLERLMRHHGPMAKGIVWEHNTHVGDARATDMASAGMLNVGQLVRERHAHDDVVLVGYGGYSGSVIAGDAWDAPMRRMRVPAAQSGSWEALLHRIDGTSKLLVMSGDPETLRERRGHRAIGVVYNPALEAGNYVPTHLAGRYDAFIYIDETRALHPLHLTPHDQGEPPETYPWGM